MNNKDLKDQRPASVLPLKKELERERQPFELVCLKSEGVFINQVQEGSHSSMPLMPDAVNRDPLQLLTVVEVAQLLRIKPKTVYAWVSQRKIRYVKVHGTLRFLRRDIEALMMPVEMVFSPTPAKTYAQHSTSVDALAILAKVKERLT